MEFVRRHSLLLTALALVVTSIQLMSVSVRHPDVSRLGARGVNSMLVPFEKMHHEVTETLSYVWRHYIWLLHVESEREEFRQRVRALEAQSAKLTELESENQRLRLLQSFRERTALKGVSATVVGRDPSNWARSVTIDRGSDDGIAPGFPVVDGEAIVGQTTAVSRSSATVMLLTDNLSAIGALVQSSRAPAIAEGTLEKLLQLRYVAKEYSVQIGDRVVSAGVDGVFPKGVLLGVVNEVKSDAPGMFQTITVQPSVDVNRLENVLVLVPSWNMHFKEQYEK